MPATTTRSAAVASTASRWLLLIHQLPAKPDYVRVKVRRRLRRLGAVAIKNAVYVLPNGEGATEDFQWLLREIVADGGEALLAAASLVEGLTDDEVIVMFNRDRDADYQEIAATASQTVDAPGVELARLQRRFEQVSAIDHFGAPERAAAVHALAALEARARAANPAKGERVDANAVKWPVGRTWVTRRNVHIDRLASAWLILRFIDPAARFQFVATPYEPAAGELRFDMFEGEYTHEGERCTFETLLARFALEDEALTSLGQIVHDIDFKTREFAREETTGVAAVVDGIAATVPDDHGRLTRSAALFDGLYAVLSSRAPRREPSA
jgi:hypothetical protein